MRLSRTNLFTNCNFTGETEIGKGEPFLAAKISPGGPILEGGPKFSLQYKQNGSIPNAYLLRSAYTIH